MSTTLKGRFKPLHPEKYKGDPQNIWFRSSWERDMMGWLDKRDDVISWMSEERVVWYKNPVTKKNARYFPDFIMKVKESSGSIKKYLIEVKPKRQTVIPKQSKGKKKRTYINEVVTYNKNLAKWKAAQEWCDDRMIEFKIITEDELSL